MIEEWRTAAESFQEKPMCSCEWQNIETAPKDGTEVLLRSARGRIADGAWGQSDGRANPNCWVWPYINQEPTHWQPLPPAPSTEGEANGTQ